MKGSVLLNFLVQRQKLALFYAFILQLMLFYACLNSTSVYRKDSPSSSADLINKPFTRLYASWWLMEHQVKKKKIRSKQSSPLNQGAKKNIYSRSMSFSHKILLHSALKCVLWQEWCERENGVFSILQSVIDT